MSDAAIERAYNAAIARVVRPGDIVLDLGGGFGRRAVRACQHGAVRAYTVQPEATAEIARAVVRDNGCADRVDVIETLPAGAAWLATISVVIAEDPGGSPLHGASLTRFGLGSAAPWPTGAVTIPRREDLSVAIVEAPDLYARHTRPWDDIGRWDLSLARRLALNSPSACAPTASQLLTAPRSWGTVHYGAAARPRGLTAVLDLTIERAGCGHGIVIWPLVDLADSATIGNSPGTDVAPIAQSFFPWLEAVPLSAGDRATVELRVEPLARGFESCLWNWTTTVQGVGGSAVGGRRFVQSTFLGSLELLTAAPALSAPGDRAEKK